MNEEFENFNDDDEEWLNELEIRAADLENELFDWREAHARELADTSYGRDGAPRTTRDSQTGPCGPSRGRRSPGKYRRDKHRCQAASLARNCITSSRMRTRSRTRMI